MDTRILFDYIRRRRWLWGLIIMVTFTTGFSSNSDQIIFLAMALMYVSITPMASELQKQGPIWIQQVLPIRKKVLVRTVWILQVVLPVLTIAASLLPAFGYGLVSGSGNLATTHLFQFITLGFLFTSAYFFFLALTGSWWKYKLLRTIALLGLMVMSYYLIKMLISGLHWEAMPTRLGLIAGATFLVTVSYMIAPQILRLTGQKHVVQRLGATTGNQLANRTSISEQVLASPLGRALVAGLWFLIVVVCFNLFFAMQSEKVELLNGLNKFPAMITIIVMLPIFLWIVSAIHITSIRGMACLPLSPFRRTLTFFSLPVITLIPLALFMTLTVIFTTTEATDILRMALVMLYGLMMVHIGLALHLRFGKTTAIISLVVMMQVLMMRFLPLGKHLLANLSVVEIPIALGMILLAGLWIHRILGRHDNVYRQQLISAEMFRS